MKKTLIVVGILVALLLLVMPTAKAVTKTLSVVTGTTVAADVGQATEGEYTWISSNESLATVSTLGIIRGISEGTVTVTATNASGVAVHVITVNIICEEDAETNPKTASSLQTYVIGGIALIGGAILINTYKKSKLLR